MNEIKPGQQFWEGPRTNAGLSDLLADGRIPHSPALPALARLLADEPGLASDLGFAISKLQEEVETGRITYARSLQSIDSLRRLAAALATKEDGDGNG